MMTRGDIGDRPVAVLWMPNRNERYEKVGHLEVIPEEGGPHTELVEEIDPSLIAEDPPGLTVCRVGECPRARPGRGTVDLRSARLPEGPLGPSQMGSGPLQ
jgi:hypothetical protein